MILSLLCLGSFGCLLGSGRGLVDNQLTGVLATAYILEHADDVGCLVLESQGALGIGELKLSF